MQAAIVAVGDELTSGERLDTNSAWLSQQLGMLGIPVALHATAPDDLTMCQAALELTSKHADIIVVTGGLGPTQDDLTREAIAELCNVELRLHVPSRQHIEKLFAARGREMPASNLKQAMLPVGATAIPNPHGSAPGIDIRVHSTGGVRLFALPGVPAEMKEMWDGTVAPTIRDLRDARSSAHFVPKVILHRRLKCFGVGESALEAQVAEFLRRGREPSVGITVHRATITLRITSRGPTVEQCEAAMNQDVSEISGRLGELIFGEGDDELHHVIVRNLAHAGLRVCTSERATRGLLARWLSSADPDSSTYAGGIVGGNQEHPPSSTSIISMDQCREEADRLRTRFGTDSVIVLGNLDVAAGIVPILAVCREEEAAQQLPWAGHPDIREERTAKTALNMLRRLLIA